MAAQDMQNMLTDRDMPALFQWSDRASRYAQTLFFRLLGSELILITLGTFVSLLSSLVNPAPAINIGPVTLAGHTVTSVPLIELAAGALIFFALVIRLIRFFGHFDTKWYEARAVAESAKSVAWRYAVGGRPFGLTDNPQDPNKLANTRSSDILTDVGKRWRVGGSITADQITDVMRELRSQSLDVRRKAYLVDRIRDQRDWYTKKQRVNHRRALFANWALVILEFLGIVFAVLQALGIVTLNLQTLAAALITGGIAWTQAQRYQDLSASYGVAASEAAALEGAPQVHEMVKEDEWAAFVDSAEAAFSREHRLWRAVREPEPPDE
jgi:hypothetical protein